jgi:NAD(P)H-hydrate epimerase
MKIVSAEQMRELDRRTIDEFGTPGEVLMERAGLGLADVIRRLMDYAGLIHPSVHFIAGRGNNGGDAFVAARLLHEVGIPVDVWIAGRASEFQGDALKAFSKMAGASIPYQELPTNDDWEAALQGPALGDILVDGVLGTGTRGPARGPVAGAIQYINRRVEDALVVAIDIPSGLHADDGQPLGEAVRADVTVTMGLPKCGLVEPAAQEYVGSLEVVDIGIPEEFVEDVELESTTTLICASDLRPLFPRRARHSHKGNYGRVLLMGGARGYVGAIAMATRAAVRSGAGLVTTLVPERLLEVVAGACLEAMIQGVEETRQGAIDAAMWPAWENKINDFDAFLFGPGMTRGNDTLLLVRDILRDCRRPLVLDADAIAVMANQPDWIEDAHCPVVLTPHPGELALLFGQTAEAVQKDRMGMAVAAAKYTKATVILKGAGTIVAGPDRPTAINLTGNPGMATGGTGDVLAGLVAGLLAQGLDPFDAACAAVFIHGRAGDLVAWRKSQAGLAATDLIEELPYVFREISLR